MAFEPEKHQAQAVQVAQNQKQTTTLEQRIAQKEAQLARLKERERTARNKKLILLGIIAEKAITNDDNLRTYFNDAAQRYLNKRDLSKISNRYGSLDV